MDLSNTIMFSNAWLLIAIPLASATILLLLGSAAKKWGHWLGTVAALASFVYGACLFAEMFLRPAEQRAAEVPVYTLIDVGTWHVTFGLLIDQLSVLFVLLITGVGSLIHIYSIGYMAHDERRSRFFGFLNLFIAAMLLLVTADSYLLLFFGWEGVGLASYLLISFWQERPAAAEAGKKAFVMNRVGDIGVILAMSLLFATVGSVQFTEVFAAANQIPVATATLIGFFLLLGACGKSAQVPLQAWLLDAMEGPTPVSALIHAATMVTAGVYLITRSGAIFEHAPAAATGVVIVGTVTMLAGAWIGTSKDDIKKALAGSTMSQIGYMMMAAGIGGPAYAYAIFHLLTHGFFKANMFLGAGSVMHGMSDDVNMRRMGGLVKFMRVTTVTFAMGYLAIIGFPLFAGFFSKDHIIVAAFEYNPVIGICAMIGALITAYYMTRMMLMTFFGKRRWVEQGESNPDELPVRHPHESPLTMTIPLIILAIFSVGAGLLMNHWIGQWLHPVTDPGHPHEMSFGEGLAESFGNPLAWITLVLVAIGVGLGWLVFGRNRDIPLEAPRPNPAEAIGRNDLYGDAINNAVVVTPFLAASEGVAHADEGIIDGAAVGSAGVVGGVSTQLKRAQNGYVRSYAVTMTAGAVLVGLVLILGRLA